MFTRGTIGFDPSPNLHETSMKSPRHLFSGYVNFIGQVFGLDGMEAARSDRYLQQAPPPSGAGEKSWEKSWEIPYKPWENYGKTMGKYDKIWESHGKIWENYGKTHRKMEVWVLAGKINEPNGRCGRC